MMGDEGDLVSVSLTATPRNQSTNTAERSQRSNIDRYRLLQFGRPVKQQQEDQMDWITNFVLTSTRQWTDRNSIFIITTNPPSTYHEPQPTNQPPTTIISLDTFPPLMCQIIPRYLRDESPRENPRQRPSPLLSPFLISSENISEERYNIRDTIVSHSLSSLQTYLYPPLHLLI